MVHTDPNQAGRFASYYNLRQQQRVDLSQRRNPSYDERFSDFAHRKYLVERGLDLSKVDNARAHEIVAERGWQNFIRTPDSYDPALVLEFYAAMIPPCFEEFSVVHVRGRVIRMTNDDIAEFYGVPRHRDLDPTFGIPAIPGVGQNETHSPVIARSLRRNNRETWVVKRAEIQKNELEPELGLWLLFLKGTLTPSTHHSTLNPYVARIMYCIQHGMPLDIGYIIRLHMIDAAAENCKGVLPFPCLITQFCRNAGIEPRRTIPPYAPIDRTAYRLQVAATNRLHAAEQVRGERMRVPTDADDEDVEDVDYDPGEEDTRGGGNRSVRALLQEMQRENRVQFGRMNRAFQFLGVPDEEEADEEEAGPSREQPTRRQTKQRSEAGSSRRRRNRD